MQPIVRTKNRLFAKELQHYLANRQMLVDPERNLSLRLETKSLAANDVINSLSQEETMRRAIVVFLTTSALGVGIVAAQAAPVLRTAPHGIAIEAMRPDIKFADFTTFSLGYFLSGHTTFSKGFKAILELPFAYADYLGAASNTTMGNPYLGVLYAKRAFTFELGARAPLAGEDEYANLVGAVADLDRIEAFVPHLIPVQIGATFRSVEVNDFSFGLSATTAGWFTTDETSNELLAGYAADVRYAGSMVRAGARINGRAMLTESGSFSDRTSHSAGVFADVGSGRVHPGVQFRLPLDKEQRDDLRWVLGVNLQVELGTRPVTVAAR
jgi:hypothetical protein